MILYEEVCALSEEMKMKSIWTAVLVLLLILSMSVFYNAVSSKSFQSKTIESLDEKKTTVLELTASSTAASAAISMLPGDVGTPIAEKLADLSGYFLVIFCAIYFEKYLFTISGFLAFRILFPVALIFLIGWLWSNWPSLRRFGAKLVAFGLILFALIPASMAASDYIEKTYKASYEETIQAAKESSEEARKSASSSTSQGTDADSDTGSGSDSSSSDAESDSSNSEKSGGSWWDKLIGSVESGVSSVGDSIANATTNIADKFDNLLSRFIDAIAVLMVTSCLIPIAILVIFIYVTKLIFGISKDIPWPNVPKGSRVLKKVRAGKAE